MKRLITAQIASGNFALSDILRKIDTFYISGEFDESDRLDLIDMARSHAEPSQDTDIMAKLIELEHRVTVLEKVNANVNAEDSVESPAEEFVPGKWYHNGDECLFDGKTYICVNVPEGQVCAWSPRDYPNYWTVKE